MHWPFVIEGATQRRVRSGAIELAVTEAGDPGAATIVFVHGYPDTRAMWAPVLERLAEDGIHGAKLYRRNIAGKVFPRREPCAPESPSR
jgi:pimeloyl-ACP methyl ester carboxylesterase